MPYSSKLCKFTKSTFFADLIAFSECIHSITGFTHQNNANSDVYIIKLTNTNENDMKQKVFMKVFLSSINQSKTKITPLMYYYFVYLNRIKRIVDESICPFFMISTSGRLHVPPTEIIDMLTNRLVNKKTSKIVTNKQQIQNTFYRNLQILLQNTIKPNTTPLPSISFIEETQQYNDVHSDTIGFVLTESLSNCIMLESYLLQLLSKEKPAHKLISFLSLLFVQLSAITQILQYSKLTNVSLYNNNLNNIFIIPLSTPITLDFVNDDNNHI